MGRSYRWALPELPPLTRPRFVGYEAARQQGKAAGLRLTFDDGGEVPLTPSEARQLGYVYADGEVMLVTTRTDHCGNLVVTTHTAARRRAALAEAEEMLRNAGLPAAIPALRALAEQRAPSDFDARGAAATLAALCRPTWDSEPLISLGIGAPTWADWSAARYPLAVTDAMVERIAARLVRSSILGQFDQKTDSPSVGCDG